MQGEFLECGAAAEHVLPVFIRRLHGLAVESEFELVEVEEERSYNPKFQCSEDS